MEPVSREPGGRLGRWAAQSIVAGSMLGIGIFIAPPVVAQHIHSSGYFLLMWLLGGLAALCGALCVAELGAMMPRAGGEYPYLRLAYGPGIAFATGWLQLLATFPGSLARCRFQVSAQTTTVGIRERLNTSSCTTTWG